LIVFGVYIGSLADHGLLISLVFRIFRISFNQANNNL
jgi:hypothetical protein